MLKKTSVKIAHYYSNIIGQLSNVQIFKCQNVNISKYKIIACLRGGGAHPLPGWQRPFRQKPLRKSQKIIYFEEGDFTKRTINNLDVEKHLSSYD